MARFVRSSGARNVAPLATQIMTDIRNQNSDSSGSKSAGGDPGRQEAMPLHAADDRPPTKAQESAREAIDGLVRGMARSVYEMPGSDRQVAPLAFLPKIDQRRRSRVVLIEGERGSGKTSLMLTVLKQWSSELEGAGPGDGIVPVGIVELAPLPNSTSLLFLLASSLRPIVTELERERIPDALPDGNDDTGMWLRHRRSELSSRGAWRRFVRTAAAGWSREMPARQTQLDAEAFAIELEQAEDQRLQVVAAFRDFVDALIADTRRSERVRVPKLPLFVVPIDDADMNPGLAVQLLELIRTLHHQRLVFLLTGSSDLFRDTLMADLSKILVQPVYAYAGNAERQAVVERSFNLGQRIYDKSIPPGQRIRLDRLVADERFDRVADLLVEVPFDPVSGAGAPFSRSTTSQTTKTLADVLSLVPVLRLALPAYIREAIDFRGELDAVLRRHDLSRRSGDAPATSDLLSTATVRGARPIVDVVRSLWSSATRYFEVAQVDDRRTTDAVRIRPMVNILEVEAEAVHVSGKIRYGRTYSRRVTGGFELTCCTVDEWTGNVGSRPVPEEMLASFLLASAVALEGPDDIQLGDDHGWRNFGSFFVKSQMTSSVAGRMLSFGWPLFDSRLIIDVLLFARAWPDVCRRTDAPGEEESIDLLARRFLALALVIADDRWSLQGWSEMDAAARVRVLDGRLTTAGASWELLGQRLQGILGRLAFAQQRGALADRDYYLHHWTVRRVGLLATPESGLPAASVRRLLDALLVSFDQQTLVREVEASRCTRIEFQLPNGEPQSRIDATTIVDEIDDARPQHPWVVIKRSLP